VDCSQLWKQDSGDGGAVYPAQILTDVVDGEIVGLTAVYDKSVSTQELRAPIDMLYAKSRVTLHGGSLFLWRVEPEQLAVSLMDRDDGTKQVIYLKFGTYGSHVPSAHIDAHIDDDNYGTEPAKNTPPGFTGFWKWHCSDEWGVQIKKQPGNLFSVSFCGPGGCFEPGTWMPNTSIVGDPQYRYINPTTLAIQHGNGWQTLTKCTTNTNPVLDYSTMPVEKPSASELGSAVTEPDCGRTAKMRVYSDADLSEETGDVGGTELAITEKKDSTVDALLFVYEGAPNDEAISLSGSTANKHLTLQGNWVEHLVEYPSKKEIVQTHFVTVDGTLDLATFRGELKIEGLAFPVKARLKRVPQIWVCRKPTPAPKKP
jgi:hypothetical protein